MILFSLFALGAVLAQLDIRSLVAVNVTYLASGVFSASVATARSCLLVHTIANGAVQSSSSSAPCCSQSASPLLSRSRCRRALQDQEDGRLKPVDGSAHRQRRQPDTGEMTREGQDRQGVKHLMKAEPLGPRVGPLEPVHSSANGVEHSAAR